MYLLLPFVVNDGSQVVAPRFILSYPETPKGLKKSPDLISPTPWRFQGGICSPASASSANKGTGASLPRSWRYNVACEQTVEFLAWSLILLYQ
jgi:hypothetical protein